ncbi:MAG: sugar phosphate isomerase/epimerase [Planctomycetota bacterium]
MPWIALSCLGVACLVGNVASAAEEEPKSESQGTTEASRSNFETNELVAWCIVPFDKSKRGPAARAQMLNDLGIRKLAYDWRDEHIPTWDEEWKQLKAHDIELTAFWCSSSLTAATDEKNQAIFEFLKRNQVKTQLWFMLPEWKLSELPDDAARMKAATKCVRDLGQAAKELGCQVGIYNHGGWSGRPENLLAILEANSELDNLGIVYNFHHAHEDLDEFPAALDRLLPHLLCLNLNGMTPGGDKIITLSEGELDRKILGWILAAKYEGPIGILDHRNELDAAESLRLNLDGLKKLLKEM